MQQLHMKPRHKLSSEVKIVGQVLVVGGELKNSQKNFLLYFEYESIIK